MADAVEYEETITAAEMAMSYFTPLTGTSPQCQEGQAKYIENAKPGMIYDNVTQECIEGRTNGITIVPCFQERKFVEWIHRDEGGGYVAEHALDSGIDKTAVKNDQGQQILPNGHQLVETAYLYCIIMTEGSPIPNWGVIPFKSTQLSRYRQLNTYKKKAVEVVNGQIINLPSFAYKYKFTTVPESNAKGSWYGWKITPEGLIAPIEELTKSPVYQAAKAFASAVKSGAVQASSSVLSEDSEPSAPVETVSEGDVPF
mgnify:CR=1 FL=1